jgi:imidazole glycerol phosphate synthase glutamine amidotransferase subunit
MPDRSAAKVAFAATGVANLASIMAAFRRAGAEPYLASGPDELAAAAFAVLPGVGSFGSAMSALAAAGMDEAFRDRVGRGEPTMGVCAGMQLFFEGSDESPGVAGMGIVPGVFRRFPAELPVPQLGWNRVIPSSAGNAVRRGWAYFANSYRLSEAPEGFAVSWSEYGESFVAALERPRADGKFLLLCQFHPELSGPWGLELIEAWLRSAAAPEGGSS